MSEKSSDRSSARSSGTLSNTSLRTSQSGGVTTTGNTSSSAAATTGQMRAVSGYVSPYPPLPARGTTMASTQQQATVMTDAQRAQQQRLRSHSVAASTASSSTEGSTSTTSDSAVSSQGRRARDKAGEMPSAQKRALIQALNEHRINTIAELRGIERVFAGIGTSDVTRPMTAAWTYYVESNSLLTELRGLTRNYPFSSECLDDAKQRVRQDPASNRSWNYCWLVLAKAHTDGLIPIFARRQATRQEMWGDRQPKEEDIERLAQAFIQEWTAALRQMLRYWESAPIR